MAGKQIDFPKLQKEDHRVTPVMIGLSLVFALIVVVPPAGGCRRAVHRPMGVADRP